MNKYYPTQQIKSAWLAEVCPDRTIGGIKNIIGIIVKHNNQNLFYSILDDCFFRIFPSCKEIANNREKYSNKVFAEIYDDRIPIGIEIELYIKKPEKDFITKEEIIANKKMILRFGYYSDLDYEPEINTNIDYENPFTIEENIINSEAEYRKKLRKPITYDEDHIYGPVKKRKL